MKKILSMIMLFVLFSVGYSQDTTNVVNQVLEQSDQILEKAESLSDVLTPYVKKLTIGVEKGFDIASKEIPIVVKQFIMFKAVEKVFYFILGIILLFMFPLVRNIIHISESDLPEDAIIEKRRKVDYRGRYIYYTKYKNKYMRRDSIDATSEELLYYILGWTGLLCGNILIFCNIMDFIKIVFFTKLYLVDTFINNI